VEKDFLPVRRAQKNRDVGRTSGQLIEDNNPFDVGSQRGHVHALNGRK
jgi:hypothetical protein